MSAGAEFTAPWEARVFVIADQLRRSGALDWDEFQARVAARSPRGSAPRYADWLSALEDSVDARAIGPAGAPPGG